MAEGSMSAAKNTRLNGDGGRLNLHVKKTTQKNNTRHIRNIDAYKIDANANAANAAIERTDIQNDGMQTLHTPSSLWPVATQLRKEQETSSLSVASMYINC